MIQRGTAAVVWSIDKTITASGMGTFKIQNDTYKLGGEEKKFRSLNGQTFNHTFFDDLETFEIDVIVIGSTVANAPAQNIMPSRGADVTITSALDTESTGSGGGNGTSAWLFVEGTKKAQVDDATMLTFSLARHELFLATLA